MTIIHDFLKDKNILIFGLGRQGGGLGDANYLARHDYSVRVTDQLSREELGLATTDLDPKLQLSLGSHEPADIEWADPIIQNPGVPDSHPLLLQAKSLGKEIVSSIGLFVKYSPVTTIGITGTRGKTTTTMLIAHILDSLYPNQIIVGGNVPGTSGLSLFDQCENKKYAVLELSSFQLHSFHALLVSPNYAVVTNLYPDHLNRYPNMQAYQSDKEAICAYLKEPGFVVYNAENDGSISIAQKSPVTSYGYTANVSKDYQSLLPGNHNQSNIAAAITLLTHLGLTKAELEPAISDFKGVPYRQEIIAKINKVTYINDTTATTPTAATIALRTQANPVILLCGGESKKLPHDEFVQEIINNDHVKKIIFLGSHHLVDFVDAIKSGAPDKIAGQVDSMSEAVVLASSLALPGDTVLLSPGFASFDLFKNEFDRGEQFNQCVAALSA